jgi:hypothetical protein
MHSFWNSVEFVSRLNFIIQIIGACIGVLIVLVGYHLSTLQEAKARPRTLEGANRDKFIEKLRQAKGERIGVYRASPAREAINFTEQIENAAQDAGLMLGERSSIGGGTKQHPAGVAIALPNQPYPKTLPAVLMQAFAILDINSPEISGESLSITDVSIVVYEKP